MRSLRVCFILPSAYGIFSPDVEAYGGGVRQLGMVSRSLAETHDVHFVVGDYGQPEEEVRDGVTLHRSYRPSRQFSSFRKPAKLYRLWRAMQQANADVYIFRGKPFKAAITYVLSKLLRSKWVYSIRNDTNIGEDADALSAPVRYIFERALVNGDAIIAQTPNQAQRLQRTRGVSSRVIPSGYPPAKRHVPYDDREYVLWVGRLRKDQKRPHLFLELAERCPEASFRLIGPKEGDDAYVNSLLEKVEKLDNLAYLGHVDPEDIHDHYARAIALVNTSAYEGFSSTFLEAWRFGTPVLSLDISPATYTSSELSYGFADGDMERLVELTQQVADEPAERARLGEPMKEYFKANLTIERVVEEYRALLNTL